MAKTTSQIQAEKKKLQESFAPTEKKLNDTHAKQMAEIGYTPEKERANLAAARELNKRREQNVASQAAKKAKQEAKKTAVDRMWDRQSTPRQRTEEDEAASALVKARRNTEQKKKELEDYQNTEYDWTDAAARELYEKGQKQKEAEVSEAQAEQNAAVANFDRAQMNAMSEEDRGLIDEYIRREDTASDPIDTGTAAIVEHFVNQNAGIDEKKLKQLVETRRRELNAQRMQETQEKAQEEVNDGWMSATWANLKTVPANLVAGAMGTMSTIHDLANRDDRYSGLDPNSMGNQLNVYSGAVRGQTQQNIVGTEEERAAQIASLVESGYSQSEAEFIVNKGRQGLGALYQAGMSAADTGARAAAGGVLGLGAGFGATVAGLNTFSQTMSDASARGATPEQALALAVTTAGIEAATEKVPLDNLIKVSKGSGAKSLIKNILRQAGIEATEEELSLIGTTLADASIMQEKSEYNLSVAAYMASGMTEEQAREQANWDLIAEAGETAIVSGIAGGIGGFGASTAAAFNQDGLDSAQQGAQQVQAAQNQQDVDVDGQQEAAAQGAQAKPQTPQEQERAALEATGEELAKNAPKPEPAEPMTEGQRNLENAAAIVNGVQPEQKAAPARDESVKTLNEKLYERDWDGVGKRNVKAYMYENPEVKPYFQAEAQNMLMELNDSTRGERFYNDDVYYNSGGEKGISGVKRHTSDDIAYLLDSCGFTYDQIENGLKAIIEDNGAENNAASKRLEFILHDRLMNGYNDFYSNGRVPQSEDYVDLVTQKGVTEYDSAPPVDTPKASAQDGQEIPDGMKGTGAAEQTAEETPVKPQTPQEQAKAEYKNEAPRSAEAVDPNETPKADSAVAPSDSAPQNGTEVKQDYVKRHPVSKVDFTYTFYAPNASFFQKGENGNYTLYDDGTVVPDKNILSGTKSMNGWEASGILTLFDAEGVNGEKMDGRTLGYYEAEPIEYPVVKNNRSSSYIIEKKGRMLFFPFGTKRGTEVIDDRAGWSDVKKPTTFGDANATHITPENVTNNTADSAGTSAPSNIENGNGVESNLNNADSKKKSFDSINPETQKGTAEYRAPQMDAPEASLQDGQEETVSENAVPAPENGQEAQKTEQGQEIPEGMKGTGAAEQNFSGKAAYQDLLTDENTQRDRPGDVRPMEVPKTDANGRKVSEFAGNAYGAAVTPDSMANEIESLVQDGALGFDRRTNKQSLENAAAYIEQKTPDAVRSEISKNIGERKIQDGDIEKAMLLYARYANQKGQSAQDSASEIMVDLATMANISGRNLQLFGLMRRMTPEGQLMTVEKTVQRNIENLQKAGKAKKGHVSDIDPELKQVYLDAAKEAKNADTPQKQKDAANKVKQAEEAIYLSEAAKMPTTFKAKWDAWRYMSMMGNVKTNVRNVAGNVSFMPYKAVKDKMGALAEKLLVPKEKRTKALLQDSDLVAWAKADAKTEQVRDALKYSAKIGDDVSASKLEENQQIFKNKALEGYRKLSEKLPAAGDMLFKNEYYSKSLAGFLKARGYSAADVQSGKVNTEILNEARGYAIDEAMKATFNDCNAFSDFVANDLRYKGDNPFGKALNLLGEGVLPFRRTPANIVARATEYSPIGVAKGVWDAATKVRSGEMTAATAIDHISAGLTGTAAMALGYALARGICGVKLTGSDVSEDEKRQGHQEYALEFSIDGKEYSYKIDWAAPANLPLFVGANIQKMLEDTGSDADVSAFTAFLRGIGNTFEPILALSCMSSLNGLFEAGRYAEQGEALYSVVASAATSYLTQGIPSILRQTDQAMQENKQTTFANSTDTTIRDMERTAANIPFVGNLFKTEKVNQWGQKEENGNILSRALNAYVNPGTLKEIDNSLLEQEITRLNGAQENNVSPRDAIKVVSYTDKNGEYHENVRLSEDQYQTFATVQGQNAKRIADDLLQSSGYKALTDKQKAAALNLAYDYAADKARRSVLDGYPDASGWMAGIDGKEAEKIIEKQIVNSFTDIFKDGKIDAGKLEAAYDQYSGMTVAGKKQIAETADSNTKAFLEVREQGVSAKKYSSAAENIANAKGTGAVNKSTGKATVRDIDVRQAIANTTGMTEHEIDIVMRAYMDDYDPEAKSPSTTEFKYQYIREELGLSPDEYASTYRAYLDSSKKAGKIAAIRALGYDYRTAQKLYDVYYGKMKKQLIKMYG